MSSHPPRDFRALFDREPMVRCDAPGRVNLIGEHTDYSGGFVLPMAIPQRTSVELCPRSDDVVRVSSESIDEAEPARYTLGAEKRAHAWYDFVQGVTQALRAEGVVFTGFDALVRTTIPIGGGLSSSAALGVSLERALREAFHFNLDDVKIALVAQRAENHLVGAPVGVMDPLASSLADERTALFIDTRSLEIERVPLPDRAEIIVIDSGVSHAHSSGEYKTRRAECEQACALLGVRLLREVAEVGALASLPSLLERRARHVVTENARVLSAVRAMKAGDLALLGCLFNASHASMRDDFEVSVPSVDGLVARAQAEPGVFGARMTGGGFGGAIVALVEAGRGRVAGRRIVADVPGSKLVVPS